MERKIKYLCLQNLGSMNQPLNNCLNCHRHLSDDEIFCPNCGQKKVHYTLTFKELWVNLWSSLTNLDNTFFKTFKYIWKPWKLTEYYISGQRASFMNPMRLFIITILFHFGVILSIINLNNDSTTTTTLYNTYDVLKISEKIDTLKAKYKWSNDALIFSDSIEYLLKFNHLGAAMDTILPVKFFGKENNQITIKDAIELPIDSIYQKYKITDFIDKLLAKQSIKFNKDQAAFGNYIIGNLAWGIIFILLLIASLFKILYRKKKIPYVQHLVLLMNIHSLAFLINSIIIYVFEKNLIFQSLNSDDNYILLYILIPAIIFCTSVYKYYSDGFVKTALKCSISALLYAISTPIVLVITALISLFIF